MTIQAVPSLPVTFFSFSPKITISNKHETLAWQRPHISHSATHSRIRSCLVPTPSVPSVLPVPFPSIPSCCFPRVVLKSATFNGRSKSKAPRPKGRVSPNSQQTFPESFPGSPRAPGPAPRPPCTSRSSESGPPACRRRSPRPGPCQLLPSGCAPRVPSPPTPGPDPEG